MSVQDVENSEYRQKVIKLLDKYFGKDYSVEWLDDKYFLLSISEPVVSASDGKTIVGNALLRRRCILEEHENSPDSACILASVAQIIEIDRVNENERSNSN